MVAQDFTVRGLFFLLLTLFSLVQLDAYDRYTLTAIRGQRQTAPPRPVQPCSGRRAREWGQGRAREPDTTVVAPSVYRLREEEGKAGAVIRNRNQQEGLAVLSSFFGEVKWVSWAVSSFLLHVSVFVLVLLHHACFSSLFFSFAIVVFFVALLSPLRIVCCGFFHEFFPLHPASIQANGWLKVTYIISLLTRSLPPTPSPLCPFTSLAIGLSSSCHVMSKDVVQIWSS